MNLFLLPIHSSLKNQKFWWNLVFLCFSGKKYATKAQKHQISLKKAILLKEKSVLN